METLVDICESTVVSDILVDLDLALEVVCTEITVLLHFVAGNISTYPQQDQGARCDP